MIVVNTEHIPGCNYQVISLVTGASILTKNYFQDVGSGFRNLVGGEMGAYTKMLEESRDKAIQKMIAQAQAMGADAIVNVRFASSSIVQGGAEILVSGTAVKIIR